MNQIESAIKHTSDESGFHHAGSSLKVEFDSLQKAHDAIHEFMYLAPLCFPGDDKHEVSWEIRSAFLLYQWEVFHHAHRSYIEALCTYYNVAFILLRTTLELLLKGAFWECLSHKRFRDDSPVLDASSEGKKIKAWLRAIFESSPSIEKELEQVSAGIYDKVGHTIEDPAFRPSVKTLVRQLDEWGIFNPITNAATVVYEGLYSDLSADIHAVPDRTDIGRRIASERPDLFEQNIVPATLRDYAVTLHEIMDVAIVIELNILQDLIERFESARLELSERLTVMEQLELKYSLVKARELLK